MFFIIKNIRYPGRIVVEPFQQRKDTMLLLYGAFVPKYVYLINSPFSVQM